MPDAEHSWIYFGPPDTMPLEVDGPPQVVLDNLASARASRQDCKVIAMPESVESWVNPARVTMVRKAPG